MHAQYLACDKLQTHQNLFQALKDFFGKNDFAFLMHLVTVNFLDISHTWNR